MVEIRLVREENREFWFRLDRHLPENEFVRKVRDGQGYVLLKDGEPAALMRWNLFWDNTPFCNLLFVDWPHQRKGYGRTLMERWEQDMRALGYEMIMTSTQADEEAQHFYRKLGYVDSGALMLEGQAMELILLKRL